MKITHNQTNHVFTAVTDNDHEIGKIEYTPNTPTNLIATHTHVNPDFQGQGVAGKLLEALVTYAQETHQTITPECPYVIEAFRKHPERYASVAAF